MVGLSIILEPQKGGCGDGSDASNKKHSQVINKTTMNNMITRKSQHLSHFSTSHPPSYNFSSSFSCGGSSSFLEQCFLCAQKLLPDMDIYMYKGDRAFCSEECRCKQIFMDEEDTLKKSNNNCSLAAIRSTPSSSRNSSPGASRYRKPTRKNGFAN